MKVYLDASVIIAALIFPSGGSFKILQLAMKKIFHLITSQTVIEEVINNSTKIGKPEDSITNFVAQNHIIVRTKMPAADTEKYQGKVDPKDAHLIAGAASTHCQYLITLDKKHLLIPSARNQFKNLVILNPKEFLESLV